MDKNFIVKILILFSIVFILGFGLLVGYYFIYSSQTTDRQINGYENTLEKQEKSLEDLLKEKESGLSTTKNNDNPKKDAEDITSMEDYKDYVNEQLSIVSSETEDEINVIYNQAIQKIRIASIGHDFDLAADIANEILSDYVFENGHQYGTLSNIGLLYGLMEMGDLDKLDMLSMITDPVVYMSIFYTMSPDYQVEKLANEEYIYIPINEANQPSLISVEKGGALESRASEYFSDLTKCDIAKIKIEVAGIPYYVYVAGAEGYSYLITNIEMGDPQIKTRTTYSDYFKMWGKGEVNLPQD